ncbi:ubiquitin carboxyl-terminal hydrolase [Nitzschia inconspicua]|uniref:ubiquitinyl hydrolase 1 n=1 Tax=Nitzschia inconspicua TaxID=303405 RepID=A0A9K3K9T6_9STRA|nr:ubiquitin carboxyl-terminal hydrolase [Nitzschia inconspicua]KAG7362547.1 ubiquitin carboxyl-terminal hydrolase [Nitzschia inconspicua]
MSPLQHDNKTTKGSEESNPPTKPSTRNISVSDLDRDDKENGVNNEEELIDNRQESHPQQQHQQQQQELQQQGQDKPHPDEARILEISKALENPIQVLDEQHNPTMEHENNIMTTATTTSTTKDPPTTPIISNQSNPPVPHDGSFLMMDTLDLNGTTRTPSECPSITIVPRFSSPTEEPIVVKRSSSLQNSSTTINGIKYKYHRLLPNERDDEDNEDDDNHPIWGDNQGKIPIKPLNDTTQSSRLSSVTTTTDSTSINLWWFRIKMIISDCLPHQWDLTFNMVRDVLHHLLFTVTTDRFHYSTWLQQQLLGMSYIPYNTTLGRIASTCSTTTIPSMDSVHSLSQRRRKLRWQQHGRPAHISGLPNQGQSCFLNSVLQSLASLPTFLAYLDGIVQCQKKLQMAGIVVTRCNNNDDATTTASSRHDVQNDDDYLFSQQLLDLLDGINNLEEEMTNHTKNDSSNDDDDDDDDTMVEKKKMMMKKKKKKNGHLTAYNNNDRNGVVRPRKLLNPKPLLKRIGQTSKQFQVTSSSEQQDAQELLSALLGVIQSEAKLDLLSDQRLFMDSSNTDNQSGGCTSDYEILDGLGLDYDDSMMTLAMANVKEDEQISCHTLHKASTDKLGVGGKNNHSGLSSKQDNSNALLSLSGFLSMVESDQQQNQSEDGNGECQCLDDISTVTVQHEPSCTPKGRQPHRPPNEQTLCSTPTTTPTTTTSTPTTTCKKSNGHVPHRSSSTNRNQFASTMGTVWNRNTTISTMTPSPFSGWLGSTVQCTKCGHVRPIQNAPFLDVPLVPTSVPSYIGNAYHSPTPTLAPNSSSIPPCTLEECLAEFTSVERVQGVECRFCTIQREIENLEEESMMLRGAVETMEKKRLLQQQQQQQQQQQKQQKRRNDNTASTTTTTTTTTTREDIHLPVDETKALRDDLSKVERTLSHLRICDPDADDISAAGVPLLSSSIDDDDFFWNWNDEEQEQYQPPPPPTTTISAAAAAVTVMERCVARKCLLMTRLPSILCCHIQRRYFDPYSGKMEKCVQHVEFPHTLDVSPYCAYGPRANTLWAAGSFTNGTAGRDHNDNNCSHSQSRMNGPNPFEEGRILYQLESVIEHRGNANGGHYVAYRRDTVGRWYMISDTTVHCVSWQDVRCSQAYLLFYEAML